MDLREKKPSHCRKIFLEKIRLIVALQEIAFVHKIINHVEQNGYMADITELQKPPFDKPVSFIKLFDAKTRMALLQTIQSIKENATRIVA